MTYLKNQVKPVPNFKDMKKLDFMTIMKAIKKLCTQVAVTIYMQSTTRRLHMFMLFSIRKHSKTYMNFANNTLLFARCVLKCSSGLGTAKMKMTEVLDKVEEDNHAIIYLYKADKQRDMEIYLSKSKMISFRRVTLFQDCF